MSAFLQSQFSATLCSMTLWNSVRRDHSCSLYIVYIVLFKSLSYSLVSETKDKIRDFLRSACLGKATIMHSEQKLHHCFENRYNKKLREEMTLIKLTFPGEPKWSTIATLQHAPLAKPLHMGPMAKFKLDAVFPHLCLVGGAHVTDQIMKRRGLLCMHVKWNRKDGNAEFLCEFQHSESSPVGIWVHTVFLLLWKSSGGYIRMNSFFGEKIIGESFYLRHTEEIDRAIISRSTKEVTPVLFPGQCANLKRTPEVIQVQLWRALKWLPLSC